MTRGLLAVAILLLASSANAVSTTYTLDLAGTSNGTFAVDSSLAAPVGPSSVPLDDLLINLDTSVGALAFGLGDLTGGFVEARFLDGILAGLHSVSATAEVTSPGHYGIAIFLSIAAGTAAEIDPNFAGEGNFTIVSLPAVTPVDDVCCSYGFAPQAPEPEVALLFVFALGPWAIRKRSALSIAVGAIALLVGPEASAEDRLHEALFGYDHIGSSRASFAADTDPGPPPCGTVIQGEYVLQQSVSCSGYGRIQLQDDATLNLNGFTLEEARISGGARLTIKNG